MNRMERILLMLAALLAVIVMAVLGAGVRRDQAEVRALTEKLSESRSAWEGIAARKEALQQELQSVTESLKEAKLTLEESTVRAGELKEDIAELEADIARLKKE